VRALPPLREVIARHGLRAAKSLGQNFLLDEQLLDRIARVPGDLEGQNVYEVGPGPGGLTRALLRGGAKVVAVERDRRCLPALAEVSEAADGRLRVIEGDALRIDEAVEAGLGAHVAANLPYNVGTALLVRWLGGEAWPPWWSSLTLMFQLEVAERIVASSGDSAYGRLAVLAQWRSEARIAMKVHRSAFVPPPKVMSAVVHILPKAAPEGVRAATLERLTGAAFGQRRKMLRQSLKGLEGALEALAGLGIDSERRAETLSIEEFVAVARAMDFASPSTDGKGDHAKGGGGVAGAGKSGSRENR
jgi:16S rRNA (adenine1518-N6/adenine1519-N6)-dimethyltransferase